MKSTDYFDYATLPAAGPLWLCARKGRWRARLAQIRPDRAVSSFHLLAAYVPRRHCDNSGARSPGPVRQQCIREPRRLCLPHFIYLGVGHGGSTTLNRYLLRHQQVRWNTNGTETRYFAGPQPLANKHGRTNGRWYEREEFAALFSDIRNASIRVGCKEPAFLAMPAN